MKIIPPIPVTDARLTSSSVPEPDASAGEVAWTPSTAYPAGTVRVRANTHRKYQALASIANTVTTPPENDPLNWVDIGPTNRFAAFDTERNTASSITGTSISFTVTPGVRTPAVCLFGLRGAESVTLSATSAGAPVYSKTLDLLNRTPVDWAGYFFDGFSYRESAVFLDIPYFTNIVITVNISRATAGPLSLETAAFGAPIEIGTAQTGASSDILDFSRIERDAFGGATLVKRKNVPVLNVQVLAEKSKVPSIRALREAYAATPLVFLALEDSSGDLFDSLSMIGIFKRMPIAVDYPTHVLLNLECEGL